MGNLVLLTTLSEADKFTVVTYYVRERDVLTVDDFDTRITELDIEELRFL